MKKALLIRIGWLLLLLGVALSCVPEGIPYQEEEPGVFHFRAVVDGKEYQPAYASETGCIVFVPGGTDLSKLVASFSGQFASVQVNGQEQESGVSVNDFRNYKKGLVYKVEGTDGNTLNYNVKVLDSRLPVVVVTTDTPGKINSKTTWREAGIRIQDADGSLSLAGKTEIRGRGNWTWDKYPKKPYALRLEKKLPVLGMPAHKRWVLLALFRGFIGNDLAFEATRRSPALGWAPRGRYVELVLNGQFQGMYYLCEQIKIDKDRVNIQKLSQEDVTYPAVSGGYLLEYDELFDEAYKFKSSGFRLPVQLKAPDEDVPDAQFQYIRDFINQMEAEILKIGTGEESHWRDYLDEDSFADYWMVLETVNNYEAYKPRSVKLFKGRDGVDSPPGTVCKLRAGPLWDQELFLVDHKFNSKDMYYYKYLFKDPQFVQTVKRRWATYKDNILGNDTWPGYVDYLNGVVDLIRDSAHRDTELWSNSYFTLDGEVSTVRKGFKSKINWMDGQIQKL